MQPQAMMTKDSQRLAPTLDRMTLLGTCMLQHTVQTRQAGQPAVFEDLEACSRTRPAVCSGNADLMLPPLTLNIPGKGCQRLPHIVQ